MAGTKSKSGSAKSEGKPSRKSRVSDISTSAGLSNVKTTTGPRAAPSFVSTLKDEETNFPRGGGSALTPLELKQTRAEGRREADEEAAKEGQAAVKRRRQTSEREAKRLKKNVVEDKKERDKDTIRVEQLNYKRLIPGTRLLTRVHTVLPLHLILSLPNNLLAHVPITEISNTLTTLLSAEDDAVSTSDTSSNSEETSALDLATLFTPGQYFPGTVINTYPTASQSFLSQYPVSETNRLAARLELSLVPEKVNAEMVKADLVNGMQIVGEVLSEEDKGYRVRLGLNASEGMAGMEGWIKRDEVDKLATKIVPGQLVSCTIASLTAGGRVIHLTLDPPTLLKAQLSEVSNVGSILPGHLVSALITAVVPSGLNVKVCGFFDGTIDLIHLGLAGADIDEKFNIGKKIRARVIYDNLSTTPRQFSLSVLPHILSLSSPTLQNSSTALEDAIPVGKLLSSVKVTRVIPEWGVLCRTDNGIEGFVHISHISDDRIPALSGRTGQFRVDTLHRARVIGHSPLDGLVLLSFEQKVLDQVFMQVDELRVGQVLKGTIHRLTDKALFVNIHGSVDGVVWPIHYADIRLKHPEKRFKVGSTVKARIFALESARNRVVLTLKKSLVESELDVTEGFEQVKGGQVMLAVISKILDKGCIVDLFGGLRAFIPQSEASQNYVTNLSDIFFVGKPVTVRITDVDAVSQKLVASVRQAMPTALAVESLEVGNQVSGQVAQVHADQVVLTLVPSQRTALLSLSNLSNHRHQEIDQVRESLKVGEKLDDLIVVSKNAQSGLIIVANKRVGASISTIAVSGVSKSAQAIDSIQVGLIVTGQVVSHTPQGTMVQLTPNTRGRVHPCDASDDLSIVAKGEGPLNIEETARCYVLKVNPSTRIIDLSTRQSRVDPSKAGTEVDAEIGCVQDLKEGMKLRGLVKNVADHGVFVALGRSVTARIMIKELFDDYVKDWQSRFEVNQLVSGKILSVDMKKKTVEMTLRTNPSARGAKKVAKFGLTDFVEGQKVVAVVRKVEAYGMFLRIEDSDVSGLCHKSEISDNKKQDVAKALKGFREGDQVKAAIVSLDREKGKINFSIRPSLFKEDFEGEDEEMASGEELDDNEVVDVNGDEEGDGDDGEEGDGGEAENVEESDDEIEEDGAYDEDDEAGSNEGEDEDGSEDEDLTLDLSAPKAVVVSKTATKSKIVPAPSALTVTGGFDWSGDTGADAESSGTSSDDDDDASPELANGVTKTKSKGKQKALDDLTSTAPDARPESATDFERALLASPNSSFLWIQYMSFQLQLHEVEKARKIGRQAFEKINFREEEEKLNVWMALVNLEIGFGMEETMEKVFKEAVQHNDARTVYLRYAEALQAAGKEDAAEEVYKKLVRKFSAHPDSWTKTAEHYFKKRDVDEARSLLPRSMQSLDKTKHVETIEKMAVLEFKLADAERGKTLFEELVDRYPKRLDLWSVYIDQLAKQEDIQGIRGLFDRALSQKLTAKKAKFLFKKWLALETKLGDEAGQENAKTKARAWVAVHAVKEGDEEQ